MGRLSQTNLKIKMSLNSNYTRTRVKVCGMSDPDNVRQTVACGVDAIGMILHADSPRKISLDQAKAVRQVVPAFVSLVGVFVDCDAETINHYCNYAGLDLVQLHGSESNDFGKQLHRPFVKAIRAQNADQTNKQADLFPDAKALLLDPYVKGQHGGTGKQLDLSLWPTKANQPLILAGGLSSDNVGNAVQSVGPFAVDLNSGIEDSPGIKNIALLEQAIKNIS